MLILILKNPKDLIIQTNLWWKFEFSTINFLQPAPRSVSH